MKHMTKRPLHNFTSAGVTRMLCNPAYTGLIVNPRLTADRPDEYDRNLFLSLAHRAARELGSEQCIRNFLKALKEPTNDWTALIPIHESFAWERPAMVTEEDFVQAGITVIYNLGVTKYFELVIDNLAQGTLTYGYMPPAVKP